MNPSFPRPVATSLTAAELVDRVGETASLRGNPAARIAAIASPADAHAGSLAFFKHNPADKVAALVASSAAGVLVLPFEVAAGPSQALIVTADPIAWFIRALPWLFDLRPATVTDNMPRIAADVVLGEGVQIGAGSVIERGCRIGRDSRIGPHSYLGPGTVIGERAFVQNHVSLGGVGLGYHVTAAGERLFFPHMGAVIVGDDAVIGSGSVVVRGQMDDTLIGDRTRIGNLVNIGHNVKIAEDCAISSSSGIAGGAALGARCNIGIGVMVNAKIRIGDDCQIGMGSVVAKSLPAGLSVFGNPARPLPTMDRF
ncbi:MAG TPA: DapH/DapD/GlmU-related protein [Ideonella sp.]|nr:DapH/DapD/GlmU-related protein [Ideonella sp.]